MPANSPHRLILFKGLRPIPPTPIFHRIALGASWGRLNGILGAPWRRPGGVLGGGPRGVQGGLGGVPGQFEPTRRDPLREDVG